MSRHSSHVEEPENSERWLLTYSDMITLLLALFVVLFAMSSISVKKFDEFKTGVLQSFSTVQLQAVEQGGTGLLQNPSLTSRPGVTPGPPRISIPQVGAGQPTPQQIAQQISKALAQANLSQDAQVVVEQRGVVIRLLSDKVFFSSDTASLGVVGAQVVDTIAQVVKPLGNDLVIEGYTDSAPIVGGPYTSNFELSAIRAVTVLERLMKVDGIAPTRLSATGYGDTHPIASNTTPAGMAMNRRVDVVILNNQTNSRI